MILVIIFKSKIKIAFFILRIISDSFEILICWLAIVLWSEEATDEDHMDPACCTCTICGNILSSGMDVSSLVLFFIGDYKTNLILLVSLIIHIAIPIIFPFIICCVN